MVARGYASLSFLHSAAEDISAAGGADLHLSFRRLSIRPASTPPRRSRRRCGDGARRPKSTSSASLSRIEQIEIGTCRPGRPRRPIVARRASARYQSSWMPSRPTRLRAFVQMVIEEHLPRRQFDILKVAEASERELLQGLVGRLAVSR